MNAVLTVDAAAPAPTADAPPVAQRLRSARDTGLVLTCEHSANAVPAGVDLGASPALLASHRGFDIGALALSERLLGALGGVLVRSSYSRLFVDLNRGEDETAAVPPTMDGQPLPGNALDAAAREARLAAYHRPYHDLIDATLAAAQAAHERVFLLSVHSYTPTLEAEVRHLEAGVLFDDHDALAYELMERLAGQGFHVRPNQPYSGYGGLIYSANRHGRERRVPYLELELRNDLLVPPHFDETAIRVIAALAPMLARLIAWQP